MSQALNNGIVIKQDLDPLTEVVWTKPIRIKSATFARPTFWPGKLGAEVGITPEKYPKIKMLLMPNGSIRLKWHDGTEYTVGVGNVEGCVHE